MKHDRKTRPWTSVETILDHDFPHTLSKTINDSAAICQVLMENKALSAIHTHYIEIRQLVQVRTLEVFLLGN